MIHEDPAASNLSHLHENITTRASEYVGSDDGNDRSRRSAGSSAGSSADNSGDEAILPRTFQCTLCVTCLGYDTVRRKFDLHWNDPDSYQKFKQNAEDLAEEASRSEDETRVMTFLHGYCTISKGNEGVDQRLGLTSRSEWKRLRKNLVKYYNSGGKKIYEVVIYHEFIGLKSRTDEADGIPFLEAKRWELGWLMKTNIDDKKYISNAYLQKYTSEDMIRAIVTNDPCWGSSPNSDEIEQLIQDILRKEARKLLAMCVWAQVSMKCLKQLIDVGHHHDSDLPRNTKSCCKTHTRYNVDFLQYHGMFQAAEFKEPGEFQQLPSWKILPIIPIDPDRDVPLSEETSKDSEGDPDSPIMRSRSAKDRAMIGSGAHGWVYRVKIDPYHHKLSKVSIRPTRSSGLRNIADFHQDRDAEFALKEFRATGSGIKSSRESEMLQVLEGYSHPHLTTHLLTWTHGGSYYVLFPLAICNLHHYMKRETFQHLKRNQIWLLEQFCGLASALQIIHGSTNANSDSNLSPHPLQKDKERRAGWHHDLKPENILCFEDRNLRRKVLQIADFGSSKIHIIRSRSNPTRTPRGTLTYEPPELEKGGDLSRPYDVWSLGCVFLEVLVWAMMGFTSLEDFKGKRISRRTSEGAPDDGFWKKGPDGIVVLREEVSQCMRELEKKVQDQPRQPFKELLDLITTRMLDIDSTKRIVASDVNSKLDRILAHQKKL